MKKKYKIIALLTEDQKGGILSFSSAFNNLKIMEPKVKYTTTCLFEIGAEAYHLYFISDDKIQEGDWYIDDTDQIRRSITSVSSYWELRQDYKKIVATTDKDLLVRECSQQLENWGKHFLPQIPQSLVKQYVEANGEIDEVELELEEDWINESYGVDDKGEEIEGNFCYYKLKLQNNEVIICFQDKTYTRDEVETLLYDLAEYLGYTSGKADIEVFNKWIKENLN